MYEILEEKQPTECDLMFLSLSLFPSSNNNSKRIITKPKVKLSNDLNPYSKRPISILFKNELRPKCTIKAANWHGRVRNVKAIGLKTTYVQYPYGHKAVETNNKKKTKCANLEVRTDVCKNEKKKTELHGWLQISRALMHILFSEN